MSDEMQKCFNCGANPILMGHPFLKPLVFYVSCNNCLATTNGGQKEEVIKNWNEKKVHCKYTKYIEKLDLKKSFTEIFPNLNLSNLNC